MIAHFEKAVWRDLKDHADWHIALKLMEWMPGFERRLLDLPQMERLANMILKVNRRAKLNERAPADDPSRAAAALPGLFAALDEVREAMWRSRDGGLADGHVVEGAAVAFTAAVTAAAIEGQDVLLADGGAVLEARFLSAAESLDDDYRALFAAAKAREPRPFAPWLLQAVALAMRYERPGAAVLPLLDRLRAHPTAAALEVARALGVALPALPGAGERLGTGREVRPRIKRASQVHGKPLGALDGDGPDEIAALCDPVAFATLDGALLSTTLRFNDRVLGPGQEPADAAVRVAFANLALRAQSRRRFVRETDRAFILWAPDVFDRIMGLEDAPHNTGQPPPAS